MNWECCCAASRFFHHGGMANDKQVLVDCLQLLIGTTAFGTLARRVKKACKDYSIWGLGLTSPAPHIRARPCPALT